MAEAFARGRGERFEWPDVAVDEGGELLCRVWAAIRSSGTPARAAAVACPARREWPVIRRRQAGGLGARPEHPGDASPEMRSGDEVAQIRVNTARVPPRA